MNPQSLFFIGVLLIWLFPSWSVAATFRVATYNVENYLDEPTQTRVAKSAEAKAKVRDSILALKPDVIALQEIGALSALQELRASLKDKDLDLPYCVPLALSTAHLKSKRPVPQADEGDLRLEEAKLLREEIDARFQANPNINLVVLGDFNDTKDSASTKIVIGRGRHKLVDTRPAERES